MYRLQQWCQPVQLSLCRVFQALLAARNSLLSAWLLKTVRVCLARATALAYVEGMTSS